MGPEKLGHSLPFSNGAKKIDQEKSGDKGPSGMLLLALEGQWLGHSQSSISVDCGRVTPILSHLGNTSPIDDRRWKVRQGSHREPAHKAPVLSL